MQRSLGDWTRIAMEMPEEGSVALSADLLIYLQRTMKLLCPIFCSNSTVCEHTLKNSVLEFINLNWQRAITTAVDPMHASFTADGNKQRLAGITGALVLGPLGI